MNPADDMIDYGGIHFFVKIELIPFRFRDKAHQFFSAA